MEELKTRRAFLRTLVQGAVTAGVALPVGLAALRETPEWGIYKPNSWYTFMECFGKEVLIEFRKHPSILEG